MLFIADQSFFNDPYLPLVPLETPWFDEDEDARRDVGWKFAVIPGLKPLAVELYLTSQCESGCNRRIRRSQNVSLIPWLNKAYK